MIEDSDIHTWNEIAIVSELTGIAVGGLGLLSIILFSQDFPMSLYRDLINFEALKKDNLMH